MDWNWFREQLGGKVRTTVQMSVGAQGCSEVNILSMDRELCAEFIYLKQSELALELVWQAWC